MNRRVFLLGFALCASPSVVLARPRRLVPVHQRRHGDFEWKNAGTKPYTGSVSHALDQLGGGLMPPSIRHALEEKVARGRGGYTDTIPEGFRFTRMLFGAGTRVPNVVARPSHWQKEQPRTAKVYEVRAGSRVYLLVRPDVCGNWSLRILTIQGECVRDELLCDGECESLRAEQEQPKHRHHKKRPH